MFYIEKLDKSIHNRNGFVSINPVFDEYLKKFASQDIKRNQATIYVAVKKDDVAPKSIYGYFSINSYALIGRNGAESENLSFEPYGYLPAILIGRIAIAQNQHQLRGFELLGQALRKCKHIATELGVSLVLVEPINERAIQFYKRAGFTSAGLLSKFMYLPISIIEG